MKNNDGTYVLLAIMSIGLLFGFLGINMQLQEIEEILKNEKEMVQSKCTKSLETESKK